MKWLICGLILCTGGAFAQTPHPLTLDEAIRIGRENNRGLMISAARAEADLARASEAGAQRYAGLSLYGAYSRLQEGQFRLTAKTLPIPISAGDVPPDQYVLRLGLRQPLFTGSRISGSAEAAALQANASALDRSMSEMDVTLSVTSAYWTLHQTRQVEKFSRENVQRLESYRTDTDRLMKAGAATRNDLLRIEVQLSSARINLIEMENDARIAEMNLNNVLGQPTTTPLRLTTIPEEPVSPPATQIPGPADSLESLVGAARAQRSDLRAASTRVRAAGASVSAAKGGWWPQIELNANLNYNNPNARYQPITPEFLGSWDVGLTLSMDLWNWGATKSRVEQAEATLKQAQLQQVQLSENVSLEVHRAALNLRRSHEKLTVAEMAVGQATENLRVSSDKYRSGLATSSELLDAEVSLLQMQTQLSGAHVEVALARAALTHALGNPTIGGTSSQ
jgi:outer membrane protein